MKIYHYSPNTFEFLGDGEARKSPKETNVYLLPAAATFIKPENVTLKDHEALIFDEGKQKWKIVADFRGVKYWTRDGQAHEIVDLGEEVPDDASLEYIAPPKTGKQHLRELKIAVYEHVQKTLDIFDYDSIDSLSKYTVIDTEYKEECEKLIAWVVSVWKVYYEQINSVENVLDLEIEQMKQALPGLPQ